MFHRVYVKWPIGSRINSTNVHVCNHLLSGTIFKAGAESAAKNTNDNSLVDRGFYLLHHWLGALPALGN
jgi:hypothetical protein